MNNNIYFVFEVESVGLYGSAFAFGIHVISSKGEVLDEALVYCYYNIDYIFGSKEDKIWVKENVVQAIKDKEFSNIKKEVEFPDSLCERFWG